MYIIYLYSEALLNRPTMDPTINGPFREVVGLYVYHNTPVTPNSFLLRSSEWAHTVCKLTERSVNLLNIVQTY